MSLRKRKNLPSKSLRYTSKDFDSLKDDLKNFVKNYFPNAEKDFSDASTGQMMLEAMAAVGDMLSFYMEEQFKELFLDTATDVDSILALARTLGYKPRGTTSSIVRLKFQATIPTGSIDSASINSLYAPIIRKGGSYVVADNEVNTRFTLEEDIYFAASSSKDPDNKVVYEVNGSGTPTKYLVTKYAYALSGEVKSYNFTIGAAEEFLSVPIDDSNVIEIISVYDSDGNRWYEVDYLAQDKIEIEEDNNISAPNAFNQNETEVEKVLNYIEDERRFKRFVTYWDSDGRLHLMFGPGIYRSGDDDLLASPDYQGLPNALINSNIGSIDPAMFLNTRGLGESPANTILTIKYKKGNGEQDNVLPNTVTRIGYLDTSFILTGGTVTFEDIMNSSVNPNQTIQNDVLNSITVTNDDTAVGASNPESLKEIKQNAKAFFATQNRLVTKADFEARIKSLPSKYGVVYKAYATKSTTTTRIEVKTEPPMPPPPQKPPPKPSIKEWSKE